MSEHYILEKLGRILRALGLSPSVYKKQRCNALDIRSYSKVIFELLPEKTEYYQPRDPLAYIAGLFDGDGYMGRDDGERWVFSQAKIPHLAEQVQRILSEYGRVTIRTISREHGWRPISRVSVLRQARNNLRHSVFAQYCTRLGQLDNSTGSRDHHLT